MQRLQEFRAVGQFVAVEGLVDRGKAVGVIKRRLICSAATI